MSPVPTGVREVRGGEIHSYEIGPAEFGLQPADPDALRGGDPETNAAILLDVLAGRSGSARDAAIANAAAALYVSGRAADLAAGTRQAARALDSGAVRRTLDNLRDASRAARAETAA